MEIEKVGPKLPIEQPLPEFDREQAFLLYATFTGDAERTAHCLGVQPIDVLRIADDEGWNLRLQSIIALKKSNRPGDIERALNRAQNFVQAFRMRVFIERVLNKLTGLSSEQLDEYVFASQKDKKGDISKKLTTRAIADLTSALEKCHALTYLALNDTVQDRTRRKEQAASDDDSSAAGELNVQIANAMGKLKASASPRALMFDAQLAIANEKAKPLADDSYVPDQH
jgi:hypothetical protein